MAWVVEHLGALCVLAATWAAVPAAHAGGAPGDRATLSLDEGWRFQLDTSKPSCSPGELPLNLNDQQCFGLLQKGRPEDGGPNSPEACRAVCCGDNNCNAWQWCPAASECSPSGSCWIGFDPEVAANGTCAKRSGGWQGGGRHLAPAPAPLAPCTQPECQPAFDDEGWRLLDVPHDFVVEGVPVQAGDMSHGYLPYGRAWYRRTFQVLADAEKQSVWLDFEGVMVSCQVWLNGLFLGQHLSGYVPFRFEIGVGSPLAAAVRWGADNTLAVHVDATNPDGWWYDGGGIYRHVRLTTASPVHIAQWGVYAPSMVHGAIDILSFTAEADVSPAIEVENAGVDGVNVHVRCDVRNADGVVVGTTSSQATALPGGGNLTITPPPMLIHNASLWTLERPSLYTLTAAIFVDDVPQAVDSETVTFGVRKTTWSADNGFALNTVGMKILGVANHQDFPAVGVAVPDQLQEHRLRRIMQFGGNAWRTAHNPPNMALLDAADRLGVLVWDENHRNGQDEDMATLVRRDRNHPSVVFWSICNEVLCTTDHARDDAARLRDLARKLDPLGGRVVSANQNDWNGPDTMLDVQGYDYNTEKFDAWHQRAPNVPAVASETSSAVSDRGEYQNNSEAGHVSGYDVNKPDWGETAQVAWSTILERPFIAGGFTWTGWDYRGEPTPYAWPDTGSHFGILDAAGFWKDRAYWYHAWWAQPNPPVLHVFPHWNWSPDSCYGACRAVNGTLFIDVWAFSNAEEVELWLPDGTSCGRRQMERYSHVEWPAVPYQPGRLTAAAYLAGRPASYAYVDTTGPSQALRLSFQDGVGSQPLQASDFALVSLEVVDAQGRVVPVAADVVTFRVGCGLAVRGTANGDPANGRAGNSTVIEAFHGLALAVLQATADEEACPYGKSFVQATAPGLNTGELAVKLVPGGKLESTGGQREPGRQWYA